MHNRRGDCRLEQWGLSATVVQPSNVAKIIYVDGVIDANVDDNNQPSSVLITTGMVTPSRLTAAYDPAVWVGRWFRMAT